MTAVLACMLASCQQLTQHCLALWCLLTSATAVPDDTAGLRFEALVDSKEW